MGEMITIPRAEYEALLEAREELEDIRAYDEAKREDGTGVPSGYVERLIEGENPVRVYRDLRGLTAAELAKAAGLHRVQITKIETGQRSGTVETMKKLAEALGVSVDDLI